MHIPGLATTPATGTHARHVIPAAIDNAGLLLATLRAAFKTSLPPSEATA
jgi:hypothetical protein